MYRYPHTQPVLYSSTTVNNKIVTTCSHCFNSLEKDYRAMGLEAEILTYTVFLEQLLAAGRLKINAKNLAPNMTPATSDATMTSMMAQEN